MPREEVRSGFKGLISGSSKVLAPPVYKPNLDVGRAAGLLSPNSHKGSAPPVYRPPTVAVIAQRKNAPLAGSRLQAPPVYRPDQQLIASSNSAAVQRTNHVMNIGLARASHNSNVALSRPPALIRAQDSHSAATPTVPFKSVPFSPISKSLSPAVQRVSIGQQSRFTTVNSRGNS